MGSKVGHAIDGRQDLCHHGYLEPMRRTSHASGSIPSTTLARHQHLQGAQGHHSGGGMGIGTGHIIDGEFRARPMRSSVSEVKATNRHVSTCWTRIPQPHQDMAGKWLVHQACRWNTRAVLATITAPRSEIEQMHTVRCRDVSIDMNIKLVGMASQKHAGVDVLQACLSTDMSISPLGSLNGSWLTSIVYKHDDSPVW